MGVAAIQTRDNSKTMPFFLLFVFAFTGEQEPDLLLLTLQQGSSIFNRFYWYEADIRLNLTTCCN